MINYVGRGKVDDDAFRLDAAGTTDAFGDELSQLLANEIRFESNVDETRTCEFERVDKSGLIERLNAGRKSGGYLARILLCRRLQQLRQLHRSVELVVAN